MTEYEIKQARAIANLVTGVEGFTRVCTQADLQYLARAVLALSEGAPTPEPNTHHASCHGPAGEPQCEDGK